MVIQILKYDNHLLKNDLNPHITGLVFLMKMINNKFKYKHDHGASLDISEIKVHGKQF